MKNTPPKLLIGFLCLTALGGISSSLVAQNALSASAGNNSTVQEHESLFSDELLLMLIGGVIGIIGAFTGSLFKAGAAHQIFEQVEKALVPINATIIKAGARAEEMARHLQEMKIAFIELKHEHSSDRALFNQNISTLETLTNKKLLDLEKRLEEHHRWLEELKEEV